MPNRFSDDGIEWDNTEGEVAPDKWALIPLTVLAQREVGGTLVRAGMQFPGADFDVLLAHELTFDETYRALCAWLGRLIVTAKNFTIDGDWEQSSDGLWHFDAAEDPATGLYTIHLKHPAVINGAKGDKGDKGDTGNTGAQGIQGVQGIQGNTGAQGVKGDTGAQGSQGYQGVQGEKGDTGAKGDKGDKGDTGTGAPYDPGQPPATDYTASQDSCNVASYFAHKIIQAVVGKAVDSYVLGKNIVDTVLDIVEFFPFSNLDGAGICALVVRDIFDAIAYGTVVPWQTALADDTLWSDLACHIYCAITPNRTITDGTFSAVVADVSSLSYPACPQLIPACVDFITGLGAVGCRQLCNLGVYIVYDCSGCGCPEGSTWSHTFDFILSDQGWLAYTNNQGTYAYYSSGHGWGVGNGGYNIIRKYLSSPTVITGVTVYRSFVPDDDRSMLRLIDQTPDHFIYNDNHNYARDTIGGLTRDTWSGLNISNVYAIEAFGDRADLNSSYVTKVILTGTGYDPFQQ